MAAADPQVRIEMLEQALHWAQLTIQKKDAEIQAGFLRETLDFFLAEPGRFGQLAYWKASLEAHSRCLETLGKQDEAYRYLQQHAQRLPEL